MDLNINTLIWLPLGLGFLGFVEPCSIGGHLVFLGTQENRTPYQRVAAVATFALSRSLVDGRVRRNSCHPRSIPNFNPDQCMVKSSD